MSVKLTTEIFIDRANLKHNNLYDYSKTNYINARTNIIIICKKHGEFTQSTDRHINQGSGCPKCGMERSNAVKWHSQSEFIEKANLVHNNRYTYLNTEYKSSQEKVKITCKEHGDFLQTPVTHLQGSGCPKCKYDSLEYSTKAKDNFIEKANKIHKFKFDYSLSNFINSKTPITILCPTHGEFTQKPYHHLQGTGCQKCGRDKSESAKYLGKKEIETRVLKAIKGKGELLSTDFNLMSDYIDLDCNIHGKFSVRLSNLLTKKQWCKACALDGLRSNNLEFIEKAKKIHGNKFDYTQVNYTNTTTKVDIICPIHGIIPQIPNGHLNGNGCYKCHEKTSKGEKEVVSFINKYAEVISLNRSILNGKELDIYIPSKSLAIEYNGLYWHSDRAKEDNYHLQKTKACNEKGIRLIHIFEDEWLEKREIVESRLLSFLGAVPNRIYGRKTAVKEVPTNIAMEFLNKNHIQGKVGSKIKLGLYHKGDLVSIMTFGSLRVNMGRKPEEGHYELLRFCTSKGNLVVGGASKLLKHFIKEYHPKEIISYADLRWSEGNVYEKLGFAKTHESKPNYFYTKGITRENRFKFRKSELVKLGYDKSKSERQIMNELGYSRIYDCGTIKYTMDF